MTIGLNGLFCADDDALFKQQEIVRLFNLMESPDFLEIIILQKDRLVNFIENYLPIGGGKVPDYIKDDMAANYLGLLFAAGFTIDEISRGIRAAFDYKDRGKFWKTVIWHVSGVDLPKQILTSINK